MQTVSSYHLVFLQSSTNYGMEYGSTSSVRHSMNKFRLISDPTPTLCQSHLWTELSRLCVSVCGYKECRNWKSYSLEMPSYFILSALGKLQLGLHAAIAASGSPIVLAAFLLKLFPPDLPALTVHKLIKNSITSLHSLVSESVSPASCSAKCVRAFSEVFRLQTHCSSL